MSKYVVHECTNIVFLEVTQMHRVYWKRENTNYFTLDLPFRKCIQRVLLYSCWHFSTYIQRGPHECMWKPILLIPVI